MVTFTPEAELQTLFYLSADRRIISTREPNPSCGPLFVLIRNQSECAWAIGVHVENEMADQLNALAIEERPTLDFRGTPQHAERYARVLAGEVSSGPAFTFPDRLASASNIANVDALEPLQHHFVGWTEQELPERSPIIAVYEAGAAVSVCFCARRSPFAAEAGVETVPQYRGRGLAPLVTAAWAASIRRSGLLPIYSTSWENSASLAVARKLGLTACAQIWSIVSPHS